MGNTYYGFLETDKRLSHMKITKAVIPEVLIFEPTIHQDDRGYFMETFRKSFFDRFSLDISFVQDNQSLSKRGTLRGLHYQLKYPQGKLVRVLKGEIFDVAVDLRRDSPSFGRWLGEVLSAENRKQLWIPPRFAHGFLVLSETAEMSYKCTDYFHPEDDHSLLWNDPDIAIKWPHVDGDILVSEKDRAGTLLTEASVFE